MISNLEIKLCFLDEWNYNGMDGSGVADRYSIVS